MITLYISFNSFFQSRKELSDRRVGSVTKNKNDSAVFLLYSSMKLLESISDE